ncbi:hypothetical protein M798_11685 [Brucella melitensis ADMAS-G1]|nr:hypothetical protein M798_11685 [Brucella melitensis ADMAS-G1]
MNYVNNTDIFGATEWSTDVNSTSDMNYITNPLTAEEATDLNVIELLFFPIAISLPILTLSLKRSVSGGRITVSSILSIASRA